MATRTLTRRAPRDRTDETDPPEDDADDGDEAPAPKAKKARTRKAGAAPAKARVRKTASKIPPVMFARWAVCDNAAKRVAVFEYKDRAGATAKLAEVRERKTGTFFMLLVKDPCDPPAAPA